MSGEKDNQDQSGTAEPYEPKGGEDEGSASHDGKDDHLKEDQKPTKR